MQILPLHTEFHTTVFLQMPGVKGLVKGKFKQANSILDKYDIGKTDLDYLYLETYI